MRKLIPDKRLIGIALTASVCMLVFLVVYNDYRDKAEDAVHNINGETDVDIVSINELTEEMTDIFRPSVYDTVPEEEEIVVPVIERVEFTVTDIEPAVTMYVNDTLNVRNGADISYDRIGRLYWASAVNVTGETDTGWYRIVYNGETAYVSGDYVQKESPVVTSAVVFVGDSRTVQMSRAVARNNYTWIGKVGMGYSWFSTEALPLVDAYTGEGTKLLINMGVNDLANASKYVKLINSKIDAWDAAGAEVYYASVNPVVDGKCNASNAQIEKFNATLQGSLDSRIHWIDSYSYTVSQGFSTSDGLHYSKATSQMIYAYYLNCMSQGQ